MDHTRKVDRTMRLKRLVCRGFKSFADRTEFDFDANLTGIIGPNGCGKSNVVDALKWVLGDQRARSLRGKEMTDVIFKGAEGREAMQQAEVTIVLESDGANGDAERTELSFGRRLNLDKESSYLVNGDPVRLRDVRDALMDTGLGVGAYSVMEQGRIDAVLSANPEDRRAIFEEAAGISRFKLQKKESLRKLERTELNLARVRDLLEERGSRIRSLKVQAGKARRYREIQGQLRELKAAVAVVEARAQRTERDAIAARLAATQEEQRELERRRSAAAEQVRALEQELAAATGAIEGLRTELQRVVGEREAGAQRAQLLEHRAEELAASAQECAALAGRREAERGARDAGLAQERARLAELEARLVALGGALESSRERLKACQRDVKRLQEAREAVRAHVLEGIHRRTRVRNEVHDHEAQIRAADARGARVAARLNALRSELERVEAARERLAVVVEHLVRHRAQLRSQEEGALRELAAADAQAAELVRRESELRQRLSAVQGSLEVLEDMEAHHEGLDQGPRFLLDERPEGLRGRLLELLDVDVEHGAALEAALGPFVQALVVDTREHAQAMLARLATERAGRALLLVEEAFQAGPQPPASALPDGVVPLASLVRCPEGARGLVDWLLQGVVLASSLAAVAGRPELCAVTGDGDLAWGARLEGGRSEGQGGMVVRRAQIHRLEDERKDLEARLAALSGGVSAAAARVATLKAQARRCAEAAGEVRNHEQEALAQKGRLEGRARELAREREHLALEEREVRHQRSAALAALSGRLFDLLLLERLERRRAAAEEGATAELESAQGALTAAQQADQETRLEHVAATTDRQALAAAVKMHEQAVRDLDVALEDLRRREREALAGAAQVRAEAAEHRAASATLDARRGELDAELERAQQAAAGVQRQRSEVQASLQTIDDRRSALGEEAANRRLELSESEHRFARIEERLREETGIELRRCLGEIEGLGLVALDVPGPTAPAGVVEQLLGPPLPPDLVAAEAALQHLWERSDFDSKQARAQAQVMQAQVDRLGHVNLDAERELADMEESFGFLEKEVADLTESRKHLMETLRRLEAESRALFEATFAQARENFLTIFRKLFQGGRADMFLTEGEDALEAGIEIVARPPGKQLQSINLLSGGERSLTALAILFAVFKVKPSPFCILDEVDAALDETNVERFLRVLREFVGPTQFCIVTHHKRTMAECQVLYGITMQRRGVSSRIAVSLDEVDGFADGKSNGDNGARAGSGPDPALMQRVAGEEQVGF
jgi:chromosome segregation protein